MLCKIIRRSLVHMNKFNSNALITIAKQSYSSENNLNLSKNIQDIETAELLKSIAEPQELPETKEFNFGHIKEKISNATSIKGNILIQIKIKFKK